jgi:FkbM family methyltransferase
VCKEQWRTSTPLGIVLGGEDGMDQVQYWGSCAPRLTAAVCIGVARYGIFRGKLRKMFRETVARAGPYDITIDGIKMRCHMGDNFTDTGLVMKGARQDAQSLRIVLDALSPGNTFVDLGANCGLFSLFAARKVTPSGRVLSVEPLPLMTKRLRFNISANGFNNVTVVEAAVGAHEGVARFFVNERQHGESTMLVATGTAITVPASTLQTIILNSGLTRVDTLKIDVEGYEDRALLPLIQKADRSIWPRKVFMETRWRERWASDCVNQLIAHGYELKWSDDRDALLTCPQT